MRLLLSFALALLTLLGCGPRAEAVTAASIAAVVNAAKQPILDAYALQRDDIIAAATSEADGLDKLNRLDTQWKPIRESHEALRLAHAAWAGGIEAGDTGKSGRVKTAYCVLRSIAAERVPLPDWPTECPQ